MYGNLKTHNKRSNR